MRRLFHAERAWIVGLIGAVALAAGLRVYRLGAEDYWVDEVSSLLNAAGTQGEFLDLPKGVVLDEVPRPGNLAPDTTTSDVLKNMRRETHPPLYFMLLFWWRRLFGDGELAVRLLPVLFSVLSLVPVCLTLRAYGRATAGAWAAGLLAVLFAHLQIGTQNRQYSLALLLVACAYWFWAELERAVGGGLGPHSGPYTDHDPHSGPYLVGAAHPTGSAATGGGRYTRARGTSGIRLRIVMWSSLYGLALLAAMFTHYFAAVPLAAHALYVLGWVQGRLRWLWLLVTGSAAGVFSLLWLPTLWQQRTLIGAQSWLYEGGPSHTTDTLIRLANLPVRLILQLPGSNLQLGAALLGVLLLVGIVWLLRRSQRREVALFALWYLLPVAFFAIMDLATNRATLAHLRFPFLAVAGLAGLMALAASTLPRWWGHAALAGVVVLCLAYLHYPTRVNPEARAAAAWLDGQVGAADLVVYDGVGELEYWPGRLLLLTSYYEREPRHAGLMLSQPPSAATLSALGRFERVFVISGWSPRAPWQPPAPFEPHDLSRPFRGLGPIRVYQRLAEPAAEELRPAGAGMFDAVGAVGLGNLEVDRVLHGGAALGHATHNRGHTTHNREYVTHNRDHAIERRLTEH